MKARLDVKKEKYIIIISYKDEAGKHKQKWIRTGLPEKGNKRKAEQLKQEALRDFEAQQAAAPIQGMSMKALVNDWLKVAKTTVRENSYNTYVDTANLHVIPYFEALGVSVQELSAKHVQDYYTAKNSVDGISPATLEKHRTVIRSSLEYAIRTLQVIEHNPCDRCTLPKKQKRIPKFYTDKQIKVLFKAVKGEAIEAPVRLCATYGLRRSEALGLRWSAVDFKNGKITVEHTIVRTNKKVIASDNAKSSSSFRSMPLTKDMRAYLKQLQAHQKEMKQACGDCYDDNDYICKWDDGTLLRPDYVTNRFRQFLKDKNLPAIRFHDLRHSSASVLINMGFSLKEVQEWLGQAKAASTEIYAHLLYKSKQGMANKMDKALAS